MDIQVELSEIKKASDKLIDAAINAERLGDRLARVSSNIIDRCYQQGGVGQKSYNALMQLRWQVIDLKKRAAALNRAVEIYNGEDEKQKSKGKKTVSTVETGYDAEWTKRPAVGVITAVAAAGVIGHSIEELYPDMGQFLFASYRDGEEYSTTTADHIKYGIFNVFDIFESEVSDRNGYQYNLYRSTLEAAIKDSVNTETSGLDAISQYLKDAKDIKTVVNYLERMVELVEKGEKALLPEELKIEPYLKELDLDKMDYIDTYENWVKRSEEIKNALEPIWTDYSKNLSVLESLKNIKCFENDKLQNQIVDDMISDYRKKFNFVLKNAHQVLQDYTFDVVKSSFVATSPPVAVVKIIDTTIDCVGIVSGQGKYADYIEDYLALDPALSNVNGAYVSAYKKMRSGNFLATDRQNFENLFNLNKQLTLKHMELEKKILEHKNPSGYADRIELLDQRINRLNHVVLEDRSTWLQGDSWDNSGGGFR